MKPSDNLRLPIYALWSLDADPPKKGDPQRVYAAIRLMVDGCEGKGDTEMRLADLCRLTAPEARTHITPKRLFDFVNRRLTSLGLSWRKEEKWPGRKVVTDLWGEVWNDFTDKVDPWDLHLCAQGPFASKDNEGALTVRDGIGALVLTPGVLYETPDEQPDAVRRWYASEPDVLEIRVEESRAALQEGQLVLRDGARWRPADLTRGEAPEASVGSETPDGYTLDRSPRAIVLPFLASMMRSYIQEARASGDKPSLQGFARRLQVYASLVAEVQHEDVQRAVVALPFRLKGPMPTSERDQQRQEEAALAMMEAYERNCGHMGRR